jgi:outer membrane protein OmpA-like peptidoglycan-associated protein
MLLGLLLAAALAAPDLPTVDTPVATGATAPLDYAVVIGIEDYFALPKVDFAARDADAFTAFLRTTRGVPRGRVVPLVGRISGAQILAALEEAGRQAGQGGTVWVYFSGHGAADPTTAERVLLPVETTQDVPGFQKAGIALRDVERLASAGGAQVVVVADACFGGVGRDRSALLPGGHLAVPPSLRPPEHGASWVATAANEVAVPLRDAGHGAFTYAVLGALRGWADGAVDGARDGRVTSEEADAYVRSALREMGIADQRPSWAGVPLELVKGRLEPAPSLPRVSGTVAPTPPTVAVAAPTVAVVGGGAGASLSDFDRQLVEQQCVDEAHRLGPALADRAAESEATQARARMAARWTELAKRQDACLGLSTVELRAPCVAQVQAFLDDAASLAVERSAGVQTVAVKLETSVVGQPIDCGTRSVAVPGARRAVTVPEVAAAKALLTRLKTPPAVAAPPPVTPAPMPVGPPPVAPSARDQDGDGIPDASDACPIEPEIVNGTDDADGCPDEGRAALVGDAIVILETIAFSSGGATILPVSSRVLDAVASVLKGNPRIARMEVQGHTDSQGDDASNLDLSQRRAQAVVDALVQRGVDRGRLVARGYGETMPIDTNGTEAGRAHNRRVEFVTRRP